LAGDALPGRAAVAGRTTLKPQPAPADNPPDHLPAQGGPVGDALPLDPDDKPKPDAPRPAIERVDWLVGSEDGITADRDRAGHDAEAPLEAPRLSRPIDPDAGAPRSSSRIPLPFRTPASGVHPLPKPAEPPAPEMPSWSPGASSIPMMKRASAPAGAAAGRTGGPIPELSREFPMDDAEERARISAQHAEQQAREAAIAARPHAVVKPQEFDLPTIEPSGWSRLPNALASDRRVQLAILVVVLGIIVAALWPRAEKTISVAHLKEHADRYADQQVRVGGRVSEVFPVGGSVAYTLVQGRDTIVVFSRSRSPKPREHVIVLGTLSTGYLGGETRTAIFESTR
jgi:hypothetical protein